MGAYGVAIVVLTIIIKVVLAPLFQLQLVLSRRAMLEQRKVQPELAELRKKYKGDAQKLQAATMELYKQHGVNPFSSLTGCLPALLQFPILTALYYLFRQAATSDQFRHAHFLFVPDLNAYPSQHAALSLGIVAIPTLQFLIIPLLAAGTTFVQSRMMQPPPNPLATEQEQQTQQMQKSMQVMMPLMIAYFAIVTPAGLGLYWFISNCVAIIQQYFVSGWGGLATLFPRRGQPPPGTAPATQPASGGGPPSNRGGGGGPVRSPGTPRKRTRKARR